MHANFSLETNKRNFELQNLLKDLKERNQEELKRILHDSIGQDSASSVILVEEGCGLVDDKELGVCEILNITLSDEESYDIGTLLDDL